MDITRIRAAATRLQGHVRQTPLLESAALNKLAGRRILAKAECLQWTGSFKARGSWAAATALPAGTTGILAYSSGNHAQGVARAARAHGLPSVIIMPSDAPQAKIDGTRALGGDVVLYDRETESREEIGERLATERGLHLVKPYDDPEVLAGQGTTGLEIAAQAAEAGVTEAQVLVCCGGGGLTAGIALALQSDAPAMTITPVEPEGFDDLARSQKAGERLRNDRLTGSICDAIITPMPGELTFPIIQRLCTPGLQITDEEACAAMRAAFTHLRVVVEPGGAAALAAALFRTDQLTSDTVIVTLSGGNVDPAQFAQILSGKTL